MKRRDIMNSLFLLGICLALSACSRKEYIAETPQQVTMPESVEDNITEDSVETDDVTEICAPSKEEVLAMRELVLEGMADEEIHRLTENIKVRIFVWNPHI